jgi:3-oxoacyl-[acyl-carrier-protein] synthase II
LGSHQRAKIRNWPVSRFDPSVFRATSSAELLDWKPDEYFSPHRLKRLDRYAQFAVASVKLALADSGLEYSADDPQERIGVSFGTALGGPNEPRQKNLNYVLSNAFGFGGINSCVVYKKM